jgi:hypothetical protein
MLMTSVRREAKERDSRLRCRRSDPRKEASMRRLVALVGLGLLAAATAAQAKELPAQVCGAGGCVTVSDPGQVGALHSTGAPMATPDPAPFYVVRFRSGVDSRAPILWSYLYVPSARAQRATDFGRGPDRWRGAEFLQSLVAELAKELEPYPASPTWTPTAPAGDEGFPVGSVALGVLGGAILLFALWQLGRLPLAQRGERGGKAGQRSASSSS